MAGIPNDKGRYTIAINVFVIDLAFVGLCGKIELERCRMDCAACKVSRRLFDRMQREIQSVTFSVTGIEKGYSHYLPGML